MTRYVKLEAIYHDGQPWDRADRKPPTGEIPEQLFELGFRQADIYSPRYGSERVTHHPNHGNIKKDFTAVLVDGNLALVLPGDQRMKPGPAKRAKKATKKAAAPPAPEAQPAWQ